MADANELFRDALVRRQINLSRFTNTLSNEIIELLDATEDDVIAALRERLTLLVGKDPGPTTTSRLKVLERAIMKIRGDAFDASAEMWDDNMKALAKAEAAFLQEALDDVSPVKLDTVLPTAASLGSIVSTHPFEGRVMREWAEGLAETDLKRIMDSIRIGLAQGDDTDSIVRRIVGTATLAGGDGVVEITRANAAAITKTAGNHITNTARQMWTEANDDVFTEEVYVATLDAKTTPQCRALDGRKFLIGEGPKPPIHWNCRSTRVPVINGKLIGNRPAVAATEDLLEGLSGTERRAMVEKLVGQVPAATTYQQFLNRQTAAFQDEVLGRTRGALFRRGGLTLDKFVNKQGDQYTLAQLLKREPAAFRRANVEL